MDYSPNMNSVYSWMLDYRLYAGFYKGMTVRLHNEKSPKTKYLGMTCRKYHCTVYNETTS